MELKALSVDGLWGLISRNLYFTADLANKTVLGTKAGPIYKTLHSVGRSQPFPSLARTQTEPLHAW